MILEFFHKSIKHKDKPMPSWGNLFPGSKSKYKCNTLNEAFICLISLIFDH